MMFNSIRWRLVLSYVLLTLLVVSIVGVLALSLLERTIARREQAYLTSNAEAVARQAWPLLWPVVAQSELQELARTASFLGNARVQILDGNTHVLAEAQPSVEGDEFVWILAPLRWRVQAVGESALSVILAMPPTTKDLEPPHLGEGSLTMLEQLPLDTPFTRVRRWDGIWGSRFVFYTVSEVAIPPDEHWTQEMPLRSERTIVVTIGDERRPQGYVKISNGPDFGTEALRMTREALLFAAGGATLVATAVGLLVSRGLSAPLRQLTEVATRMGEGDLSTRAPLRGRGEIRQLARQFNHMAERLDASFAELSAERDALRRFIADASHELRTPITALRNFNELLQGAAAEDPRARTEFLVESQVQIERLAWITRNLLNRSRLDAGLVTLDIADHDVGIVIEDAASPFKTQAQEKGLQFTVQQPAEGLAIQCDRERIVLALSNLLDNAIKYTPPGGLVEIGVEQVGETTRLWVQDTGRGIDPNDLPHIFERFYRGRNAGQGERAIQASTQERAEYDGLGLGLAIVHSIAQAHGGRVHAESSVDVGSRFTIELPQR
jgi:signal transduction histidine kinase